MSVIYDDGQRAVYDPFTPGAAVEVRADRDPTRRATVLAVWDELDDDDFPVETLATVRFDDDGTETTVSTWDLYLVS